MTALDNALADIAERRKASDRTQRRHAAATYIRDRRNLRYWMFKTPHNRSVLFQAHFRPDDPASTRRLCHALYSDWQSELRIARHLKIGGGIRAAELRTLFTCECEVYRRQVANV